MPKELEKRLKKQAKEKGFKPDSDSFNAYVYGTLRKTGWKPEHQKDEQFQHSKNDYKSLSQPSKTSNEIESMKMYSKKMWESLKENVLTSKIGYIVAPQIRKSGEKIKTSKKVYFLFSDYTDTRKAQTDAINKAKELAYDVFELKDLKSGILAVLGERVWSYDDSNAHDELRSDKIKYLEKSIKPGSHYIISQNFSNITTVEELLSKIRNNPHMAKYVSPNTKPNNGEIKVRVNNDNKTLSIVDSNYDSM